MIPIVVFWTNYTATVSGKVIKLVPCENCGVEYVYVLEREESGVGTSVYLLNDDGARSNATAAADETLRQALENDFDPVPCPKCGHYQKYMFSKLYETTSPWGPAARLAVLALFLLDLIGALYWSINYWRQPSDDALNRLAITWSLAAVLGLLGIGLAAIERSKERRFDPNTEDQQARIERGRSRAITRGEFEVRQQPEVGATDPFSAQSIARMTLTNDDCFRSGS